MPDGPDSADGDATQRVVVLIPTLANLPDLRRCLAALAIQRFSPFSVLVVDSRPCIESAQLAGTYGAQYLEDTHMTRAAACNYALQGLDCDLVLFTDDDCYPPPDWVGNLVRNFDRPEVDGVGGPHVAPADQGFWGKAVDVAFASPLLGLGLRYAKAFDRVREVAHNPGCNAAYRKSALDAAGGFPTAPFGAEDVALDHRVTSAGYRLWFDPEAVTFHRRRDRFATLARQMWAYGRGRADTNARWPEVARLTHLLPSAVLGVFVTAAILAGAAAMATAVGPWVGVGQSTSGGGWLRLATALPGLLVAAFYTVGACSAAMSTSPYRSVTTGLASPLIMMLAVVQYGRGFLHWHRVLKQDWKQGLI